jgi:hypothetical protein
MRRIEKFETEDGTLFDKQSDAEAHEAIYFQVKEIVDLLGGTNSNISNGDCSFANGEGYYTLNKANELKARELMQALTVRIFGAPYCSVTSRVVYEHALLGKASVIFCCIRDGVRYGQPYYAINPDKAGSKEYNKSSNLKDGT